MTSTPPPAAPDRGRVLRRVYAVCQIFIGVVLLAFIVGSLLFTGGRVSEQQSTNWSEVWSWPVFPVPAWLIIVPAVVGAIVVVPMCLRTAAGLANRLLGAIGQTIVAAGAAVLFMFLFPSDSGPFPMPQAEDGYLGWHWIALIPTAFSLVVLIVALATKSREYERLRLTGGLPS
ncbi:hypothetical protein [Microbacterium sp. CFBP9034]|uniref:hypothetical protein n=1 Tax=Microbacterium sp. CFBP9034 TaxID=3096540 RepID=UPI002A6A0BD2|nr:hypothetical protein [Microbacterium sp. CFBP9034]MDY0908376.1 hypothetical protein [Microbacterium sp. CFBP9034]